MTVQLVGRSSSHFTRVAAMFAHELGVAYELVPVYELTSLDPAVYGGHPALKIPALRTETSLVFGTENICRKLAELAPTKVRVVWPEQVTADVARNAQELVWHAMAAQVQLVVGTVLGRLPPDNVYFAKGRAGFEGALRWLDDQLAEVLRVLPSHDVSLVEVTLFCLIEHMVFRPTLSLEPYPALVRFAAEFAARPSAQRTHYRYDPPVA